MLTSAALSPDLLLRLAIFAVLVVGLMGLESRWPRRPAGSWRRSGQNLALLAVGTVIVRLVVPLAAVGTAAAAESLGFGLFNLVPLPALVAGTLTVVLLDLGIYFQHRAFHHWPVLWRLHRVHHSDIVFDVTTGVRFHPLELLVSMFYKMALVAVLGAPVAAVVVFEVLLSSAALFSHSNLRLPASLDGALRRLIVTPDMHRVHHSVDVAEHNRNFGFCFSCWDRWFGTYVPQPARGHREMRIGLDRFRGAAQQSLIALLLQPFDAAPSRRLDSKTKSGE